MLEGPQPKPYSNPSHNHLFASCSLLSVFCYPSTNRCFFTALLLRFLTSPLIHIHLHPLHRLPLVQLRRLNNQLLQRRPLQIPHRPHLYVPHALPRPFQQSLRVRQRRATQENKRHMFLSRHETAHRPVRVKRRNLPRIHILLASPQCLLHQRTQTLHHTFLLSRFLHILVDPRPSFFSLNRRHRSPSFLNPPPF